MSLKGILSFTPDNSTGDGVVIYKTSSGTLEFATSSWGKYIAIPSEAVWNVRYASTWAKDRRDEVIVDIISQRVPIDWPKSAVDDHGITFFDPVEDAKRNETGRHASSAVQSPDLSAFLHSLDVSISKLDRVSFFTFKVLSSADGKAEAIVTEVFRGASEIAGLTLSIGYFSDVSVFAGRQYFTHADTADILEYITKRSRWRYRLCIEVTEEQKKLARKFFAGLGK